MLTVNGLKRAVFSFVVWAFGRKRESEILDARVSTVGRYFETWPLGCGVSCWPFEGVWAAGKVLVALSGLDFFFAFFKDGSRSSLPRLKTLVDGSCDCLLNIRH